MAQVPRGAGHRQLLGERALKRHRGCWIFSRNSKRTHLCQKDKNSYFYTPVCERLKEPRCGYSEDLKVPREGHWVRAPCGRSRTLYGSVKGTAARIPTFQDIQSEASTRDMTYSPRGRPSSVHKPHSRRRDSAGGPVCLGSHPKRLQ